jgi:hypothetical protein
MELTDDDWALIGRCLTSEADDGELRRFKELLANHADLKEQTEFFRFFLSQRCTGSEGGPDVRDAFAKLDSRLKNDKLI